MPSFNLPLLYVPLFNIRQIVYCILLVLIFYTWDSSIPFCMDVFLHPMGRLAWLGVFAVMLRYDVNISILMAVLYTVVSQNHCKLEAFNESNTSSSHFDNLSTTINNLSNVNTRMSLIANPSNLSESLLEQQIKDIENQNDTIHSSKVRELDRLINIEISALESEFLNTTPA